MADWAKMRTEYESTAITMTELAKRNGVAVPTVSKYAKKHGWVKVANKKTIVGMTSEDAVESMSIRGALAAATVATQRIEEFRDNGCDDPQALKAYMSVLLDAQKAAGAFTGWTKRELQARIKQIEKQTADEEQDGTGVVVLPEILPPIPIKAESEVG